MRKRQFTKSLSVALPEDHFELIRKITDEEQISMAEYVRTIVDEKLDKIRQEVTSNETNQ
jgi:predicted transcriptional regulator